MKWLITIPVVGCQILVHFIFFLLLHGMRSDAVRKIEERTQSVTAGRTIRKEAFMGGWMADEGIDSRHLPHYDQGVTHPY
jgi:hypothetical protein